MSTKSSLIPANYILTDLTFEYDGATDSRNACPRCDRTIGWYGPAGSAPEVMQCEDCEMLCDVMTEQVWAKPADKEPRHPMYLAGAIRERINELAWVHHLDLTRLTALCAELEQALTVQQRENSIKFTAAGAR